MRAAVYIRMSTDRQEDSPERQRGQIIPYCKATGYQIVREYADEGERGWSDDRPGLKKLLADADRGLFDVIVVDEMSRLSRHDPIDFSRYVAGPLRDAGVLVDSVAERGVQDWDSEIGSILMAVGQSQNNKESRTLGRRVLTGYDRLARNRAIQTGKPVLGYRRIYENDKPKLVLGPAAEVATIRFIFDCYVRRGMSLSAVCRALEARGTLTPTGKPVWKPVTVRKILMDETYIGTYVFNRRHYGKYTRLTANGVEDSPNRRGSRSRKSHHNPREDWQVEPNYHEPIVDAEVFRQAQHALADRRRRTTPLPGGGEFLLSKLLVCSQCGGWMCGQRGGSGRRKDFVAYRCSRAITTGRCRLNLVREQEVVPAILTALKNHFLNPEFLQLLREEAAAIDEQAGADEAIVVLRAEIDGLTKQIAQARRNLSRLPEDMLDGVVADIRRWESRKTQVEQQLADAGLPRNLEEVNDAIAAVEDMLRQLEDAALDSDREALRAMLRQRIAWVEIKTTTVPYGKKGRQSYKLAGGRVILKPEGPLPDVVNRNGPIALVSGGQSFSMFNIGASDEQAEPPQYGWTCHFYSIPGLRVNNRTHGPDAP